MFNFNVGQHKLVNCQGALVIGPQKKTFAIYDTSKKQIIYLPMELMAQAVTILAGSPMVNLTRQPVHPAPQQPQQVAHCSRDQASTSSATSSPLTISQSPSTSTPKLPCEVWVKNSGKPTPADRDARDLLISIVGREDIQSLLQDKKTVKKNVFIKIAREIEKAGYSFGARDAGQVCLNKFTNMERQVLEIIANGGPKRTGLGSLSVPDYYDDVYSIIKDSAKCTPKNLQDSMSYAQQANNDNDESLAEAVSGSDSAEVAPDEEQTSRFNHVKTSSKPAKKRANSSTILEHLKEEGQKREDQTNKLLSIIKEKGKKDRALKKKMLQVLQFMAGSSKKMRKDDDDLGSSDDSDSDSAAA